MKTKLLVAAGALIVGAANAANIAQLDIVVRDFDVSHPDFENFSEEFVSKGDFGVPQPNNCQPGTCGERILSKGYFGYDADWNARAALHASCGNGRSLAGATIGADGIPSVANPMLPPYLQQVSVAPVLEYGECADKSRGYSNVGATTLTAMTQAGAKCASPGPWANKVYYTPGMVDRYLKFDPPKNGEYDMYDGVHIQKANDLCDNSRFGEWYEDVAGTNFRVNKTLDLPSVEGVTGIYQVNYNYNNGGYAPLDSIIGNARVDYGFCNPEIQNNKKCEQFGPQSLSIFCPPYDYQYAGDQKDFQGQNTSALCNAWLANGGPKVGGAAAAAAASSPIGANHLRNYGFTMMGYAKFKYNSANQVPNPEVFEFVGDDDMWIFVDGVLVVDLGGTHLAAPGSVNIQTLAQNNHGCHEGEPLATASNCVPGSAAWGENTWHHLHFFYADRQTDGSNLLIRTSLAELAPSKYGQPTIQEAIASIENGVSVVTVAMNTTLNSETVAALQASAAANANIKVGEKVDPATTKYPMLVKRQVCSNGVCEEKVFGLLVTSFSGGEDMGADGVSYEFKGVLVDEEGNVVGNVRNGDALAFNYTGTEGSENMVYNYWNTHAIDIVSSSGKKVEGFPDEWAKVMLTVKYEEKPAAQDKAINRPDFTESAKKLTNSVAGSDGLPTDATGELQIIPITMDMVDGADPNTLSAAMQKDLVSKGAGSVKTNAKLAGVSLCDEVGGVSPCTAFNFLTMQAFRVNVRVFDHMGHFVSQYTQEMGKEDMAKAMGEGAGENCSATNPLHGTGAMLVSMKLYPVSQDGRKLATGPYIYQVTIVREDGIYCAIQGGEPTEVEFIYSRTSESSTRGYHRVGK